MADNYLQFSESIEVNHEEYVWLDRILRDFENERYPQDPEVDRIRKLIIAEEQYLEEDGFVQFEFALDKNKHGGYDLDLYSEESAEPYMVGLLVQEFFKRFRPQARFTLTWSQSCSKRRQGEFGGGAMLVTADEIKIMNTYDQINRWLGDLDTCRK